MKNNNTYLFSYLVPVLLAVILGLSGLVSAADYDLVKDDSIDWKDLDAFAAEWLNDCNATNSWCNGANFDEDNNNVDFDDYTLWAKRWLTQPSLVGWWRFEEGSGTDANDSSGYGNHGTLNGDPNWVAGKEGSYALDFDAVGDYVNVPDTDDSLDVDSNLTIAAWVKLNSTAAAVTIAGKQPSGVAADNFPGNYLFMMVAGGKLRLVHQTSTGTDFVYYESTTTVGAGDWDHAAVTLVEGGTVEFYIDGSPAGTTAQSATFGIVNDEPVRIGVKKNAVTWFNGTMDDLRIYNSALSEADIGDIAGTAGWAKSPYPSNGATYVDSNVVLSWTPADDANSHDVYFGTDLNDVNDANNSWPVATGPGDPNVYKGNFDVNSFDPCGLDVDTAYYWRIDEVNDANVPCKGPIWTFSTDTFGAPVANFMVIPTSGWDIYYRPEFVSKATGDITSYLWEFGDTQTSTDRAPNHQYSSAGTYTVTLTVTGPDGSDSMTKTDHITVNDFNNDYSYDDYNITEPNMTQWDDAVDAIEAAGGGRILFGFSSQTIYVNHHRDFFGNNCIVDGQDKNVKFYYNGPDDCSQTEGQDALIRFHGNDNIFRNLDFDRFPEGVHIRSGNRNLIENCNVGVICEDAMSMNGGGLECFDCIIRNNSYGYSEDKAVMVNNGGRAVFRNLSFTDSTQPIRCTGATGEYVIRHCNVGGSSNGLRHSGGSPGHLVYVEENTAGSGSQRGIRVYGYTDAIIRHNTFSGGSKYGVYAYESAKVRLEHNDIQNYSLGGVMIQNTAQVDAGGGSVTIDGSSATSVGDNTIQGSSPHDLINQTASSVKAKFNYWDHTTVQAVLDNDVDGNVDVDPLGTP